MDVVLTFLRQLGIIKVLVVRFNRYPQLHASKCQSNQQKIMLLLTSVAKGYGYNAEIDNSPPHKKFLSSRLLVSFILFCSAVAPYAYGSMYSWSLRNIKGIAKNTDPLGFPFDSHFPYIIMSINSLVVLALVYFVKELEFQDDSNENEKSTDYASTSSSLTSSMTSSSGSTPTNSGSLENSFEKSLKTEKSKLLV